MMQIMRQWVLPGPRCPMMPSTMQRGLRSRPTALRSTNKDDIRGNSKEEDYIWSQGFPSYLQSRESHKKDVCRDFDKAITAAERKHAYGVFGSMSEDESFEEEEEAQSVWLTIRREAERDAAAEPLLSSFLYATILAHDSFERALAFVLSNRLANAVMLPTQLFETFYAVLISDSDVRLGALADVEACRERDPACTSYSQALLYYKGYHAIQTHRIAHALWKRGQKVMAVALQSRMSEVLAVDIHPAAKLGHGILLDHGTGVVIGETAVIGNNVSLLQNVTLGGTGKEHGDRHPKISDNVLIGASATVLGNIRVGEGAQIAAGSLVLKPVPAHTMVAGSPAKSVGTVTGNPAESMQQWSKKFLSYDPFCDPQPPAAAAAASDTPASEAQPAAAGPADSSTQPADSAGPKAAKKRRNMLDVVASEAAWDAVAAKASKGTGDGKAIKPAPMHVHVNGHDPHAAGSNGNGKKAAAAQEQQQEAPGQQQHVHISLGDEQQPQQQQQQWQQTDAQQYMFEQVTGHQQLQPLPEAEHAHHQQQQSQQQPQLSQPSGSAAETSTQADASQSQSTTGNPPPPPPSAAAAAAGRKKGAEIRGIHGGEVEATVDEAVAAQKWADRKEDPEYVI